jgi:chemotaxis signal transduction protein
MVIAMADELSEFRDDDGALGASDQGPNRTVVRELLLFEYGGYCFAVPAVCVDSVVPWKSPAPVPGADPRVRGVIQDRGRIIVVVAHPTGQAGAGEVDGSRIIICVSPRGHVGLPATTTNSVGAIELPAEPTPYSVHDGPFGPFTYLDPTQYQDGA